MLKIKNNTCAKQYSKTKCEVILFSKFAGLELADCRREKLLICKILTNTGTISNQSRRLVWWFDKKIPIPWDISWRIAIFVGVVVVTSKTIKDKILPWANYKESYPWGSNQQRTDASIIIHSKTLTNFVFACTCSNNIPLH